MKIRKADRPGKVTVELGRSDDALLEKGAATSRLRLGSILVPVDFSPSSTKAVEYAVAFGEQFQARIVFVHVVEPMVYPENYMTIPTAADDLNASLMKAAEEKLAAQRQQMAGAPVPVQTLVRLGRPYVEITEAARELDADLIILATHGHTGLKHVLLGSTAERVVRHAPCPVLTVRDPEHDFVSTVTAPSPAGK